MTSRFLAITAAAALSVTALTACGSGGEEETVGTTQPQAAESTTPSSVVQPSESDRPWTSEEPTSTIDRPGEAPVAPAPGASASPGEQTAPAAECSVGTIAADVGEQPIQDQMVLESCDGHWANVALQSTGVNSWAVRVDDRWQWLEADGRSQAQGLAEDCYLRETIDAHAPVPPEGKESLRICGAEDMLYAN